jgi:hypothetical protein
MVAVVGVRCDSKNLLMLLLCGFFYYDEVPQLPFSYDEVPHLLRRASIACWNLGLVCWAALHHQEKTCATEEDIVNSGEINVTKLKKKPKVR